MKIEFYFFQKPSEPWLTNIVPGNVKVHIMVYYGSIQLKLISSKEEAEVTKIERTFAMSTYELWYRYERHIFEDIDLMAFDISGEVGASPYLIFEIEYNPPGATTRTKPPVPLGWARVPLYKKTKQRRNSDVDGTKPLEDVWTLLAGDFKYMLVPGQITEKYTQIRPGTPASVKSYSLVEECYVVVVFRTIESSEISDIKDLWVEHRPEVTGIKLHPQDYKETSVPMSEFISKPHIPPVEAQSDQKEIFDLYIDQVTGAIGVAPDLKVFFAVPEWQGSARNPNFTFRLTFNEEKKKMDIKLVAFLRVYTRDLLTDELIIIGSVFLPIFMGKEKRYLKQVHFFAMGNKFNIGGHQLHLRNGTPKNRTKYRETDLDDFPVVPTTTLLVRLLPHEKVMHILSNFQPTFYS
ncbi:hypothetical protein KUTeg_009504 [Tegillarca granosa]|uniref:Uncharacterized protein n=1 Tax=Tegillarca granosa TaxID=220873 RepID=A0ABQ9F7E2_TEGGR|nr:hypothetical protein KUTeg_009504 [Tegillarca granosa]